MLIHNVKLASRGLKKNRFYSFLNVTGFSVGFAAVLIIALYIYNEITVDQAFRGSDRIFRLISAAEENDCLLNFELGAEIREAFPEVETASPVQYIPGWSFSVSSEGSFAKLNAAIQGPL